MMKKLLLLILLIVMIFSFQGEAKSYIKINSTLFDNSESGLFLFVSPQVEQQEQVSVTSGVLDNNRVYFDIQNAIITHPNKTWEFRNGFIEKIRLSQFETNPAIVRVVFYYKEGFDPTSVQVLNTDNIIMFKYNNLKINGKYLFELYREEKNLISDYFEPLAMVKANEAVSPPSEYSLQEMQIAQIEQIENAMGVVPVSHTKEVELFDDYKLKSKYYIERVDVKQGNILLYGLGHTSIQKPMILQSPTRFVLDLPNTVLKPELKEKEYIINESEKVKIAQFDTTTTRVVVTTPTPEKYRPIFGANLQTLLISHDDRIEGVSLFNELAPISQMILTPLDEAMEVLRLSFKAPLIHSIKRTGKQLEIILYNTEGITNEELSATFANTRVNVNRFSPNGYRLLIPVDEKTNVSAKTSIDAKYLEVLFKPMTKIEEPKKDKIKQTVTVVIDPGHGGADGGATRSGVTEKDINLDVARKLANNLISRGINVEMTHWQDETQSLEERVDFAQNKKADIFVSIHVNASNKSEIHGIETHYYHEYSKKLAENVQQNLIKETSAHSRGTLQSKFYVINHTTMPAVLVEIGFISNNNERNSLLTEKRKQQTAEAIANGIMEFLKSK